MMKLRDRVVCALTETRACIAGEAGETLVETLISTLIVSAVILMLVTAVVTAARVNTAIEADDTAFDVADAEETSVTLTVRPDGSAIGRTVPQAKDASGSAVRGYSTDNGYVYYTYKH